MQRKLDPRTYGLTANTTRMVHPAHDPVSTAMAKREAKYARIVGDEARFGYWDAMYTYFTTACDACDGDGYVIDGRRNERTCRKCGGTGTR